MSNFQFNENPYAALEEDDEFNGPWYRNRTRTMAVILAAAAVVVLILMMWHHTISGSKLASAQSAAADGTTTAPAASADSNANANSAGKSSGGTSVYLNGGTDGKSGSSSASATASGGTNGVNGKDGVDGKTGTTIIYNTVPASPVTTVPTTKVPVTIPVVTPTTQVPLINVDTNGLLDIVNNLGNGQPLINVDAALPTGAKLTSNVNVLGVRTQTYDVSSITGHSSTVTLTFLNDLLTAKVKVGF